MGWPRRISSKVTSVALKKRKSRIYRGIGILESADGLPLRLVLLPLDLLRLLLMPRRDVGVRPVPLHAVVHNDDAVVVVVVAGSSGLPGSHRIARPARWGRGQRRRRMGKEEDERGVPKLG